MSLFSLLVCIFKFSLMAWDVLPQGNLYVNLRDDMDQIQHELIASPQDEHVPMLFALPDSMIYRDKMK